MSGAAESSPFSIGFIAYSTNCTRAPRGRLTKKPGVQSAGYVGHGGWYVLRTGELSTACLLVLVATGGRTLYCGFLSSWFAPIWRHTTSTTTHHALVLRNDNVSGMCSTVPCQRLRMNVVVAGKTLLQQGFLCD